MSAKTKPTRIAIIGTGRLGSAAAYSLLLSPSISPSEILLCDPNLALLTAQVADLADAAYALNSNTAIRPATYHEAGQCDIIIITAGSRHIGESVGSVAAMGRNASVVRSVVSGMAPVNKEAVVVVAAEPVDVMTGLARGMLAGVLEEGRVLGVGTYLESVRLRGMVAGEVGIAANSIDMYVVGVHGECQVPAWSAATIGGVGIDQALAEAGTTEIDRKKLADECKRRTHEIRREKGATPFGTGAILASICASVLLDRRNVRPVSHFQPEHGCCLSAPAVLGRGGIVKTIPLPLAEEEQKVVAESAARVKREVDELLEQCKAGAW